MYFVKWAHSTILLGMIGHMCKADFQFAPSQWETLLQSNGVSHWLGTKLESALHVESVLMGAFSFPLAVEVQFFIHV